jgi:hypothetical protein
MGNASDKSDGENQNTDFTFCNIYRKIVYEIMWKNTVEPERPVGDNTANALCMLVPKATDTFSIQKTHCPSTATDVARTRLTNTS